jgi:hypothetical protein
MDVHPSPGVTVWEFCKIDMEAASRKQAFPNKVIVDNVDFRHSRRTRTHLMESNMRRFKTTSKSVPHQPAGKHRPDHFTP